MCIGVCDCNICNATIESFCQSEEISKTSPLCPYLQAYGRCRDAKVCNRRHWISKTMDSPNSNPNYVEVRKTILCEENNLIEEVVRFILRQVIQT